MKLYPFADRVVVKPSEAASKVGTFYIPEQHKEKPAQGEVIAVGSDVKEVKVGDTVIYNKYGPSEVMVDGDTQLIIREEDVMAAAK